MLPDRPRTTRRVRIQPRHIRKILLYVLAAIAATIAIFPLYWVFVTSLLTQRSAFDVVPHFLPDWQWSNYVHAWNMAPWVRYFFNSILVSLCTVV
ncbi:MAG: hypothetical protein IMW89_20180, partial [Ktedonobacteraceae bacterium]|nr:hypothetical protein [Ktedonobacteraceae bacterium]